MLACDEVFGPIALVQAGRDVETASRWPTGSATGSRPRCTPATSAPRSALAARLEAGQVKVNAPTTGVDFYAPFGGEKDSSFGPREQGKAAEEFYTSTHTVTLAPA